MSVSDWLLQQEKVDVSSVVLTLIDNGKLANQIARLQAIAVKTEIFKKSPLNLKYWNLDKKRDLSKDFDPPFKLKWWEGCH